MNFTKLAKWILLLAICTALTLNIPAFFTAPGKKSSASADLFEVLKKTEEKEQPKQESKEKTPTTQTTTTTAKPSGDLFDILSDVSKPKPKPRPDVVTYHYYPDYFFYPYHYDYYHNWYLPYYTRPQVIVMEEETTKPKEIEEKAPQFYYPYSLPEGSAEAAIQDLEMGWQNSDIELIKRHIKLDKDISCYYKYKFTHKLSAQDFINLTELAFKNIRTESLKFEEIKQHGKDKVAARGTHVFYDPENHRRTVYLAYYLVRVNDNWYINKIGFSSSAYKSSKCFIATAAYGTPLSNEINTLRQFRDQFLLTNKPGKIFVKIYYHISPPIANAVDKSDLLAAITRTLLKPVIKTCDLIIKIKDRSQKEYHK